MKITDHLRDILYFHPGERRGILCLLALLLGICLYSELNNNSPQQNPRRPEKLNELIRIMDSLDREKHTGPVLAEHKLKQREYESRYSAPDANTFEDQQEFQAFYFDPNNLSPDSLRMLGLHPYAIENLIKYRSAGGTFRSMEDLKKIYAIDTVYLNEISEYAVFEKNQPRRLVEKVMQPIDLNEADASELQRLKGIGPFFAQRILSFRSSLGGFVRKEQLLEVYNLPDSTYHSIKEYISVGGSKINKLSLNRASQEELSDHPYINFQQARLIARYRFQLSGFDSLPQLHHIVAFDTGFVERIMPYLNLD